MVLSPYFSDDELINSLRCCFNREEQYTIDFKYWLNTARQIDGGFVITVKSRKFLVDEMLGVVIREL